MDEARRMFRTWWCHGGGAAVMVLLIVVGVFRAPHDAIFWAAIAFFVGHTLLSAHRYLTHRRRRAAVEVVRTHRATTRVSYPVAVFAPVQVNSAAGLASTPPKPVS